MKIRSARCRPFSTPLSTAPPAIPRPRKLALELLEDRALLSATPPNPHGLFPGERFPVGEDPLLVVLEDLNGDGLADIVTVNEGSDDVSVLLGNGDGTFADQTTYAVGHKPRAITLKDLNGDGFVDILVTTRYTVSVLLGNGGGMFADQMTYAVGNRPEELALD